MCKIRRLSLSFILKPEKTLSFKGAKPKGITFQLDAKPTVRRFVRSHSLARARLNNPTIKYPASYAGYVPVVLFLANRSFARCLIQLYAQSYPLLKSSCYKWPLLLRSQRQFCSGSLRHPSPLFKPICVLTAVNRDVKVARNLN